MSNFIESSDDGFIEYLTGAYADTYDYQDFSGSSCIVARYTGTIYAGVYYEDRAYKRFLLGLGAGDTVTAATLYWYLHSIPQNDGQKSCNLEQVNDYLTLGSADWAITVKKDYGAVMAYNATAGWKSQDVTTEMEASKTDAYVAFRWRITTQPAAAKYQAFAIRAYEYTDYKAYLAVTYTTGWAHKRDGTANASIAKIDGTAKASIAKVDGT